MPHFEKHTLTIDSDATAVLTPARSTFPKHDNLIDKVQKIGLIDISQLTSNTELADSHPLRKMDKVIMIDMQAEKGSNYSAIYRELRSTGIAVDATYFTYSVRAKPSLVNMLIEVEQATNPTQHLDNAFFYISLRSIGTAIADTLAQHNIYALQSSNSNEAANKQIEGYLRRHLHDQSEFSRSGIDVNKMNEWNQHPRCIKI